jgi:DNA helicase-2/ATP-dependent DNA helicase PcrA
MSSNSITSEQLVAAEAVQHDAAHAIEKQVRLVAGPGTGKSSTIEERIRWLLAGGTKPQAIAVVSFTRASALDLQYRIRCYCTEHHQPNADKVSTTTLHSLALRILRRSGLLAFYPVSPLVLDDWELENIYDSEFGHAQGISSKRRREAIRRFYEARWSTGIDNAPTYISPELPITPQEQASFQAFHEPTAKVYSCVLPGEIVRKCVKATLSGTLNSAQLLSLQHLVVDEYQDLNPSDLQFIDLLAADGVTVFVAGDDDQSIYSFRHASPEGIQKFPDKYPQAGTKILNDCFRCTQNVLAAATALIESNSAPNRIQKNIVSLYKKSNPLNEGVVYRWKFGNGQVEAKAIAESCASLIEADLQPNDILILLATCNPSVVLWPAIKEALEHKMFPFEHPREGGFSNSEAGMIVLSLIRIVCSRDDDGMPEDFMAHRVLLGLMSGVGVGTCDSIRQAVLATPNLSFRDLFYRPLAADIFTVRARNALNRVRDICSQIAGWMPSDTLSQRKNEISTILANTINSQAVAVWNDYALLLDDQMNLEELRNYVWADTDQQRADVLGSVYERLSKPMPAAAGFPPKIRVMTMHGAKGLSAKVVFIPGLEQGILPNSHQIPYPAQVLEAARLLYVSITRARAACILSFATHRTLYGNNQNQTHSQFAAQTGGAFIWRNGGLTQQELNSVIQSVHLL